MRIENHLKAVFTGIDSKGTETNKKDFIISPDELTTLFLSGTFVKVSF